MKFLSCGEVLWDVINGQEYLGGAPLNFAAHAARLGAESYLVTALGRDERGIRMLDQINQLHVNTKNVQLTKNFPTGWVDVFVNDKGQPDFTIHENVAWDNIEFTQELKTFLQENKFDVFCFGMLPLRNEVSRNTLKNILSIIHAQEIFFDVNIRQDYYSKELLELALEYTTVIKLNDDEVTLLSTLLFDNELSLQEFGKKLLEDYNIKIVIMTRGEHGCMVMTHDEMIDVPGEKVEVADTVGAGDAFSAGFLITYVRTQNSKQAAGFGNKLGAFVASCSGAVPTQEKYNKFLEDNFLSK